MTCVATASVSCCCCAAASVGQSYRDAIGVLLTDALGLGLHIVSIAKAISRVDEQRSDAPCASRNCDGELVVTFLDRLSLR